MQPDLSIIVVNYNTSDYLGVCLESIRRQTGTVHETFVVDNASVDDSVEMVRRRFPWVSLIVNHHNAGFAQANNQALSRCVGRYILYLNPDTEVREESFARMTAYMDVNKQVGLAGCRLVNPDGSHQSSMEIRYPGQKYAAGELKGFAGDIAWVMGAAMVAEAELVKRLQGFDEGFFIYGEDADLCLRVRKAGLQIGYIDDAVVVHWGGRSERNNEPVEVWSRKFAAEMRFFRKHYSEKAVRAIRRAHLMKAFWRVATISLTLPFIREKRGARVKLARYRHVLKVLGDKRSQ
jgi:N-acetylglucosaminyl-diphospho-decaprenol L-rhamnosyltransferase